MGDEPLKVAVIGDSKVGKSSICYAFFKNKKPPEQYRPTLAIDFFVKNITNHPIISRFAVFDVSVTPQVYARTQSVAIVYDITFRESFVKADCLLQLLETNPNTTKNMILVGNKCNLPNREVSKQEGIDMALKWKIKFVEADAMNNTNISAIFWTLAKDYCDSVLPENATRSYRVLKTGGLFSLTSNEEFFRDTTINDEDLQCDEKTKLRSKPDQKRDCCCSIM